MLLFGLFSLICALASGVFSFGLDVPPTWTWGKSSFVLFLLLAAIAFVESERHRPSLTWALIDDYRRKRRGRAAQFASTTHSRV